MRLIGMMPVRNGEDEIGLTLRSLLLWCDAVAVLNHASTDGTAEIIEEITREAGTERVILETEADPVWNEMDHRQRLLEVARRNGATHLAIVDSDELATANLIPQRIRDLVEAAGRAGVVLRIPWINLRGSISSYQSTGIWCQNWVTMAFRDAPRYCWKARDGYHFHHRHPIGTLVHQQFLQYRDGGLLHLQFLSERKLRAKQALYKMVETIRWPRRRTPAQINTMYNPAVYDVGKPAAVDLSWLDYSAVAAYLKTSDNREPWQETECKRLWTEHGPEKFRGLDLFGAV